VIDGWAKATPLAQRARCLANTAAQEAPAVRALGQQAARTAASAIAGATACKRCLQRASRRCGGTATRRCLRGVRAAQPGELRALSSDGGPIASVASAIPDPGEGGSITTPRLDACLSLAEAKKKQTNTAFQRPGRSGWPPTSIRPLLQTRRALSAAVCLLRPGGSTTWPDCSDLCPCPVHRGAGQVFGSHFRWEPGRACSSSDWRVLWLQTRRQPPAAGMNELDPPAGALRAAVIMINRCGGGLLEFCRRPFDQAMLRGLDGSPRCSCSNSGKHTRRVPGPPEGTRERQHSQVRLSSRPTPRAGSVVGKR